MEGTKKYMEMKSKLIKQLEGTKKYMKMKRTKNGRLTNKNADGTKKKCYVCNKNISAKQAKFHQQTYEFGHGKQAEFLNFP